MNRHFVSASGMVKVIRTTPLESEVNCGKKNAVSFRFLRAATLLKSLAGSKLVIGLIGESVQAAADSIAVCAAGGAMSIGWPAETMGGWVYSHA